MRPRLSIALSDACSFDENDSLNGDTITEMLSTRGSVRDAEYFSVPQLPAPMCHILRRPGTLSCFCGGCACMQQEFDSEFGCGGLNMLSFHFLLVSQDVRRGSFEFSRQHLSSHELMRLASVSLESVSLARSMSNLLRQIVLPTAHTTHTHAHAHMHTRTCTRTHTHSTHTHTHTHKTHTHNAHTHTHKHVREFT